MSNHLKCLVVEDDPVDFELLERQFQQNRPGTRVQQTTNLAEFNRALAQGEWDVVLCDYRMPGLVVQDILQAVQAGHPQLPIILVSGAIGEEQAVELLKLGVSDFVLKSNLSRLLPAIDRSRREVAERNERQAAEARHSSLFRNMLNGCAYCQMIYEQGEPEDFIFREVNQAFAEQTGLQGVAGRRMSEVLPRFREVDGELFALYARVARTGRPEKAEIYVATLREWFAMAVYGPTPEHFVAVFEVITERKRGDQFKQAVLDSVTSHIAVLSETGEILAVNARWQEFVRLNPTAQGEVAANTSLGVNYLEVCERAASRQCAEAEAAKTGIQEVITGRRESFAMEYRCDAPGERRWFSLSVTRLGEQGPQVVVMHTNITERKRAEEQLRASEQQFRAMFETAAVGMVQADPHTGRLLRVNPKMCQITGYSEAELWQRHVRDITHPDDREQDWQAFQVVVGGKALDYHVEKRYVRADGTIVWVSINMTVLRDDAGQPMRTMAVVEDITERRAAREKIALEQARFKLIFDAVPIGMAYAIEQPNGQYQRIANAAHLRICGLTAEEDNQPGIYRQITHPDDRPRQDALVNQLGPDRVGAFALEKRYVKKDGQVVWVAFSYIRRPRADGNFDVVTTVVEITERKAAEQALRDSEMAFRTLTESMPQIVWICNPAGQNIYFNQQWVAYTGLTLAESYGDGWIRPFHPDDQPVAREAWRRAWQNGSNFVMESRLRRADGSYRWWLIRAVPLRHAQGAVLKWFGTYTDINDLKLAEAALRESRAKLDAALASMTDAVFIADANGQFLDFNEAFATFHKFRSKAECARHINDYPAILDIFMPNGEPAPLDQWAVPRALRGETATNVEYSIRRKDTGESWVCSCSFSPIRDAAGAVAGAVVVARDITVSKQAEQSLRMSQFSMENSGDAIFWLAADGRFVRVNAAAGRLVGYTPEEILTLGAQDLNPAHAGQAWVAHWQELREHKILTFEALFRTKEGWSLAVEITANYINFEGQEFNCAFIRDITERKTKTEELLWKTAFLEAMVHSSADGILVVDRENRKILQNQKIADFWQIPPEIANQADDTRQLEFVQAQTVDPEAFARQSRKLLQLPDQYCHDEVELKNGTILDRHTALVRGQDGKIYGRVWTFHDITKRRQLEGQYRQAQKMEAIGTLAGGIAHDFNNILCAMFGYGYLLQQESAGNPQAREYVEEILKAANRAKDLVQQILTFSRQREQKREVIHLDTVLKEVGKFLRASLPASIQIETELDSEAPPVLADPTQIYQVAMNLATNALHAMDGQSGCLRLNLVADEPDEAARQEHPQLRPIRYTRLTVADTGHGMDARTLERIFEPFFTTKPVGKGTGLGLAVVHGIVQSHEGIITVRSQPGQGTTFDIYFPAQITDPVPPAGLLRDIPRGHGQRILILDDEPALTEPFQGLLQRLNYQVTTCNLASEALRRFRENPADFDLLITDLTMPEISGLEVARQFHDIRPDLPVILSTGYAYALEPATLREAGISELLEKPLALRALAQTVQRVLARH